MNFENNVILHFNKRETSLKWLLVSFGYFFVFSFIENPTTSTISIIGKSHLGLFSLYCFLLGAAMIMNTDYMFKAFGYKNKFLRFILYVTNFCLAFLATTLMAPKETPDEYSTIAIIVHWITGFGNLILCPTIVLLFCLAMFKKTKNKGFLKIFVSGTVICASDIFIFLLLAILNGDVEKGKNGIFEIIPMICAYLMIYIINHTDFIESRTTRDKRELLFSARKTDVLSNTSYLFLVGAWIFTTAFSFIRTPVRYTISMTGIEYKQGYSICCVLLSASLVLNFVYAFKKGNCKNIFIWAVAMIGSLTILPCIVAPTTMSVELNMAHAVSAVIFFNFIQAALVLFLWKNCKGNKKMKVTLAILIVLFAAQLITVILLFIVFKQKYGRTGLTELVPLQFCFAFFFLYNHTNYFKNKDINKGEQRNELDREKVF